MYENIPPELTNERCWVNVWNNSKIPMQATKRKGASSMLPETWADFETAKANVERGVYDGVGYVFHDNGIVGIDIDAGLADNKMLSALALDAITRCRSYTERSRSGRGFHILVRGELPFKGKNNRAGMEIYRTGRYFIMTGRTLGFGEIVENQEAIDYIVATYFPETMEKAADGSRIYSPIPSLPEDGKIVLRPKYPPILPGSRNLCLTSLAGQLHNRGYTKDELAEELFYVNQTACEPPLPRSEVMTIINSVSRYRR